LAVLLTAPPRWRARRRGYAVTLCVYTNEYLFYGETDPHAGDPEYDHIVSVYSIFSAHDDDAYHDDDVLVFSDHGLWSPRTAPQYLFTYTFGEIQGTREEANAPDGHVYTIASVAYNFGIAHVGPEDEGGELLPLVVRTSVNYEAPPIADGSSVRPAPMPLSLSVALAGLVPGVQYVLYSYGRPETVPVAAFNANNASADAAMRFVADATGGMTVEVPTDTGRMSFFRAVRADAA
jgi:hypothetical protein